jgi:multicomponent Na+:H+ antiporter subunit D
MVAPTPVSGLLHAVAVVKAGTFGILRTVLFLLGPGLSQSLGVQSVLVAFAVATIVFASLLALAQDNLKLRLAYSTIAQLSYIVLGAALLTPDAVTGASFHIAAHGFAKLAMFFAAGAIATATGKTRVSELDGVGRKMPVAMGAFALAAFALAALPPFSPFVSKGYLMSGAEDAGLLFPVLILVTSSILNVAYFFPIITRAFFAGPKETRIHEPLASTVPLASTAIGALVLGLWLALPYGPFALAASVPASIFGTGPRPFDPWTLAHALELGPVLVVSAVVLLLGARRTLVPGAAAFLDVCRSLGAVFAVMYERTAGGVSRIGRLARRSQTGDLNWNVVGMGLGLALVLVWIVWEVL